MTVTKTSNFGIAMAIAAETHKDQVDRGGAPYILHPLRVMMNLRTTDDDLMSIAILHDVIEDSKGMVTLWGLAELGFSKRVVDALELLTHIPHIPYEQYIESIATNYDAIQVKMADLTDNSDITRLKGLREKDFDRMIKYHSAYTFLKKARIKFESGRYSQSVTIP